jgi:hypothetical protein
LEKIVKNESFRINKIISVEANGYVGSEKEDYSSSIDLFLLFFSSPLDTVYINPSSSSSSDDSKCGSSKSPCRSLSVGMNHLAEEEEEEGGGEGVGEGEGEVEEKVERHVYLEAWVIECNQTRV